MSNVAEAQALLIDLVQGDDQVALREDFKGITGQEISEALELILGNDKFSDYQKRDMLLNTWKIHYRKKPPTMQEFLKPEWIGPTGLSVYDHVRNVLEDYWNPFSTYRHLLLAPAIGWGKSFASVVSTLYIMTHLVLMRDSKKFFGLSQASSIVAALVSFNMNKAEQLLLQPFLQILLSSPKFKRVRTEEAIPVRQAEFPDHIVWTTAGRVGSIQFSNDHHILVASNPGHLLGLSIICGVASELSFFLERGISPETIWRVYNDLKGRVYSRFSNRYFATTIVDSSPNDMTQSPIDKYIFSGEADKDPLNYVVTGSHWEVHPSKYPIWVKTGETFPVFRGSGAMAPKILETEEELKEYTSDEVYNVPIDIKQKFKDDLKKSVKDYCGWPAGSDERLFDSFEYIDKMFTPMLKNVYDFMYVPASESPEELIWRKIRPEFFVELGNNHYEFYRSPRERRFIHIDQSEVNDLTGFSMVHPETDKEGNIVIVVDFTLVIAASRSDRVNLDAMPFFVMDLRDKGHVPIEIVTFDQFQSSSAIQRLEREGFNVKKLSVDREMGPYKVMVSWIKNGRIKAGRNIFLKNNLKSLHEVITGEKNRKKIDHLKGEVVLDDGGSWELSMMGINAKDCSDSLCGATYNCINEYSGVPRYQWSDDSKLTNEEIKKKALDGVYSRWKLIKAGG